MKTFLFFMTFILGLSLAEAHTRLDKEALMEDLQQSFTALYANQKQAPHLVTETQFHDDLKLSASHVEMALVDYSLAVETRLNKDCLPYAGIIGGRLLTATVGEIIQKTQELCATAE